MINRRSFLARLGLTIASTVLATKLARLGAEEMPVLEAPEGFFKPYVVFHRRGPLTLKPATEWDLANWDKLARKNGEAVVPTPLWEKPVQLNNTPLPESFHAR